MLQSQPRDVIQDLFIIAIEQPKKAVEWNWRNFSKGASAAERIRARVYERMAVTRRIILLHVQVIDNGASLRAESHSERRVHRPAIVMHIITSRKILVMINRVQPNGPRLQADLGQRL